MVKKINDKLEEMERAAAADVYDNQALYAAPPSDIYGRKSPSVHGGGIYGSVTSRCVLVDFDCIFILTPYVFILKISILKVYFDNF